MPPSAQRPSGIAHAPSAMLMNATLPPCAFNSLPPCTTSFRQIRQDWHAKQPSAKCTYMLIILLPPNNNNLLPNPERKEGEERRIWGAGQTDVQTLANLPQVCFYFTGIWICGLVRGHLRHHNGWQQTSKRLGPDLCGRF